MSRISWDGHDGDPTGPTDHRRSDAPPSPPQLHRDRPRPRFPRDPVLRPHHRQDGPRRFQSGPLSVSDLSIHAAPPTARNLRVAAVLAALVVGMVGLAYAAVPL